MRPSTILKSGKHFGNLGKIYGEYRFGIAPSEQKVFKGFFNDAFVRVIKFNVIDTWYMWLPQVIAGYLLYDWATKKNAQLNRKDPKLYENDE